MTIEELVLIKEKKIVTEEDKEKIQVIKDILVEEDWMFRTNMEIVIGILEFLEVPKDKMIDYYISLISPKNFSEKHPKERI